MGTPEQMEAKEPATVKAPAKEGMGIEVALGNYQPAPPRNIRADEDSGTEEDDQDEEEDIEVPYLASRLAPPPNLSQDKKQAQTPTKDGQIQQKTCKSPQVMSHCLNTLT